MKRWWTGPHRKAVPRGDVAQNAFHVCALSFISGTLRFGLAQAISLTDLLRPNQQQGAAQALEHTLARLHDDTGYAKVWKELGRADRAVLLLAARGVQDLYSAQALAQLQELLGDPQLTASTPRTSIRRLTGVKLQLMARVDHGAYRFEDPEFQSWVAARPTVD